MSRPDTLNIIATQRFHRAGDSVVRGLDKVETAENGTDALASGQLGDAVERVNQPGVAAAHKDYDSFD